MPRSTIERLLTRRRRRRVLLIVGISLLLLRPGESTPDDVQRVRVAGGHLDAGTRISAADLRYESWRGDLPDDIADNPVGRVLTQSVLEGEPIREARLGGTGGTIAEQLAVNERAVRIEQSESWPIAEKGDSFDLAVRSPERIAVVATGTRVLEVDDAGLTVAVPSQVAAEVAASAVEGTLVLMLAPASNRK